MIDCYYPVMSFHTEDPLHTQSFVRRALLLSCLSPPHIDCVRFVFFLSLSETRVDVKESVRGQDIFIIQTIPR